MVLSAQSPLFMWAPVSVELALEKIVPKTARVLCVMFWLVNSCMLQKCLVSLNCRCLWKKSFNYRLYHVFVLQSAVVKLIRFSCQVMHGSTAWWLISGKCVNACISHWYTSCWMFFFFPSCWDNIVFSVSPQMLMLVL